ncbi:NUDIX domain-containing protein [Streptomyces sp. NPDC048717]|uniref:NUDIX hydrolase n=1 Tax=Streptomyces sp. NPDC048717 TaxID=3154928 RepID=UPI003423EC4B
MIVWINGTFGAGKTGTARELVDLIPNSTLYDPELTGGTMRLLLPRKRLAEVSDFQDLPIWRRLVVDTAAALLAELGGVLVVPMTLIRQEYRDEIFGALAARRIQVRHVVLTPDETILRGRIDQRAAREATAGPETVTADGDRVAVSVSGAGAVSGVGSAAGSAAGSGHGPGAWEGPDEGGTAEAEAAARVRRWCLDHIAPFREALGGWLAADAYPVDNSALTPAETARVIADAVSAGHAPPCGIVQTPEPAGETLAAGVLLFDEHDRVLLVDPTYKPGWEFPGGIVEPGESPARAGIREVAEEIGLRLDAVPRLLLVDWERPQPPGYGGLRLLFDGGLLTAAEAGRLRLPGTELRGWRFVTEAEAAGLLPPVRYDRLRWALRARERGTVLNLEAGVPLG